ncbi:hypothetical protein lbkm_3646 [Lachnospiraceae bacterium KM106-2]|nr:hypothetical protein lbkm_3646 [Lachnospiraceae bacterium KM106-2]
MKDIYIIGGTMGVGKTAVSQKLKDKLEDCAFLDGDWCWDMHPFRVTEETKQMVMDNICDVLNREIKCSAYQNIVFCWVMHRQEIIDEIIERLDTTDCKVHVISLVCSESALRQRLNKDVMDGIRTIDIISRSVARMPFYKKLNTTKINVSDILPDEAAEQIKKLATK